MKAIAVVLLLLGCSNTTAPPAKPVPLYIVSAQGENGGCLIDVTVRPFGGGSGGESTRLIATLGGVVTDTLRPGPAGDYFGEAFVTIGANDSHYTWVASVPGSNTFIC